MEMHSNHSKRNRSEWNFEVDYNDHFETPFDAYADLVPFLQECARSLGKSTSELIIFDPYWCQGRMVNHLKSLGFENVINRNRDFYQDVKQKNIPEYDVLVTNPPYSGDHKQRLLSYLLSPLHNQSKSFEKHSTVSKSLKPFCLLLPAYTAAKSYWKDFVQQRERMNLLPSPSSPSSLSSSPSPLNQESSSGLFYVLPPDSYSYSHPEGTGKPLPPFYSMWFVGMGLKTKDKEGKEKEGKEKAERIDTENEEILKRFIEKFSHSSSSSSLSRSVSLSFSLSDLSAKKIISLESRPNPRARRKIQNKQQQQSLSSSSLSSSSLSPLIPSYSTSSSSFSSPTSSYSVPKVSMEERKREKNHLKNERKRLNKLKKLEENHQQQQQQTENEKEMEEKNEEGRKVRKEKEREMGEENEEKEMKESKKKKKKKEEKKKEIERKSGDCVRERKPQELLIVDSAQIVRNYKSVFVNFFELQSQYPVSNIREFDEIIKNRNEFISQIQIKRSEARSILLSQIKSKKKRKASKLGNAKITPELSPTIELLKILNEKIDNFDQNVVSVIQMFLNGLNQNFMATILTQEILLLRSNDTLPLSDINSENSLSSQNDIQLHSPILSLSLSPVKSRKERKPRKADLILSDLPHNLLSLLKKDDSCQLTDVQAKLGLEILMDEEARELRVKLPAPRHDEVRAMLLNLLTSREAGSGSLCVQSDQLLSEELIGGSVRAVFRSGGTIERFLFGREFIALNLKNVPRTVTLDRLREFGASCFTTHTPRICDVSLIFSPNQNEGALGSGRITYSNPEDAAFALDRLNNKVIDGKNRVSVQIGGIQVPESPKAARKLTNLQLLVSPRPSSGKGLIKLYKNWQLANQLLSTLWALDLPFRVFALGCPSRRNPQANQPLLSQQGLFLPPETSIIPPKMNFTLRLMDLPLDLDEIEILQMIKDYAADDEIQLPRITLQSISVEKSNKAPRSDLDSVSVLIRRHFPKSQFIESIDLSPTIKDSPNCLAFFHVNISQELSDQEKFNIIQEINSHPFPPFNGLPIRFRIQFKTRISLEPVLFSTYQTIFDKLINQSIQKVDCPSQYKFQYENIFNKKSVTLFMSGPSLPLLNKISSIVRSFQCFSVFRSTHPTQESLLFSQVGVRKMDIFSTQTQAFDEVPFLLKRNPFNSLVMVYHPTKSVRDRVCEALEAMLGEMAASKVVFETWVSARTKQNMLKTKPKILRDRPNLFDFDFQKLKLIVEGCEESIQSLQQSFGERFLPNLAQAVKAPVSDEKEEKLCSLCFCPYADKFTLLCGHSACKEDCLGRERASLPPTLPAKCFSCAAPYSWSDLQSLTTPQSLATNKQQAVSKFFLENPGLVRYCPLTDCNHVLDNRTIVINPTTNSEEEKRAGGNGVVYCESCSEEYCLHCSTRDSRPAEAHPGVPCHLNQSDEIRLYVLRVEDMLCKHCPRCDKVFSDFDGCFAITCENCKCGFCGFCFTDCGSDAHSHVVNCALNPKPGEPYSSLEVFHKYHAIRCQRKVSDYLSTLDPQLRAQVVKICKQLLIDIGMKFHPPKRQVVNPPPPPPLPPKRQVVNPPPPPPLPPNRQVVNPPFPLPPNRQVVNPPFPLPPNRRIRQNANPLQSWSTYFHSWFNFFRNFCLFCPVPSPANNPPPPPPPHISRL